MKPTRRAASAVRASRRFVVRLLTGELLVVGEHFGKELLLLVTDLFLGCEGIPGDRPGHGVESLSRAIACLLRLRPLHGFFLPCQPLAVGSLGFASACLVRFDALLLRPDHADCRADDAEDKRERQKARRQHRTPIPAQELAEPIRRRRRTRSTASSAR